MDSRQEQEQHVGDRECWSMSGICGIYGQVASSFIWLPWQFFNIEERIAQKQCCRFSYVVCGQENRNT